MSFEVRRVVTGHDQEGKAIVLFDGVRQSRSRRPGAFSTVIWSTDTLPAKNDGSEDPADAVAGTTVQGGSVFRLVKYEPNVSGRMHRTDSIDYAVVVSGEIYMQMDDTEIHLKQGDVLVQRGTIHNWVNRGNEPCLIAFVLISADPVTVNGAKLEAVG